MKEPDLVQINLFRAETLIVTFLMKETCWLRMKS